MLRIMCMSVPHVLSFCWPTLHIDAPLQLLPDSLLVEALRPCSHRNHHNTGQLTQSKHLQPQLLEKLNVFFQDASWSYGIIRVRLSHHEKKKDLLRGSNAVRQHRWWHTCDDLGYTAEPSPASITLSLRPPEQRPVRLCAPPTTFV